MSEFSYEMLNEFLIKSVIHEFAIPHRNDSKFKLFVKRDDLIHKEFSGNKLRKLKYNLKAHFDNGCYGILTFGGAFSNHLLATASVCNYLKIPCIGIVRGDELDLNSNSILRRCSELGMVLFFYSRSEFNQIKKSTGIFYYEGKKFWAVPEGGANLEGIFGCREIISKNDFDFIIVAQGTATTSLGILLELKEKQKMIVVPVLKGFDSLKEMKTLLGNEFEGLKDKLIVLDQFHFGGYAKVNSELILFVDKFNEINNFQIEPVYTGKVMFALNNWIESVNYMVNKKVLFVHTGGLTKFLEEKY